MHASDVESFPAAVKEEEEELQVRCYCFLKGISIESDSLSVFIAEHSLPPPPPPSMLCSVLQKISLPPVQVHRESVERSLRCCIFIRRLPFFFFLLHQELFLFYSTYSITLLDQWIFHLKITSIHQSLNPTQSEIRLSFWFSFFFLCCTRKKRTHKGNANISGNLLPKVSHS